MTAGIWSARVIRRGVRAVLRRYCFAALVVVFAGCRAPAGSLRPDLEVSLLATPVSSVASTEVWSLGAAVVNTGAGPAAESSLDYWYSDDATLDAADVPIGTSAIPSLAPGVTHADVGSPSYAIADSGGSNGTRWIFAVVDAGGAVGESDETNNERAAPVAVRYDRLIIDTYRPKNFVIVADTFLSLFDAGGDPTLETGTEMWYGDVAPYTVDAPPVSIAEADDGNPSFASARINYGGGLAPGTYYVRVRGQKSTTEGVYAVRILLAPDEVYEPWYFDNISDDADNEIDNDPPSGGVPASPVPIAIGGKLNRALTQGDVDWLIIVLP